MNHKIKKKMTMNNEQKYVSEVEGDNRVRLRFSEPNENKITLYEKCDAVKLKYIVDHAEEFEGELIKPDSEVDWTLNKVVTILKKHLKKSKQGGLVKVNYKQNNKQGRYFGQGLQSMPRAVRHTIAQEFYYDVDIKNAHPVLLEHYCSLKGLEHTYLSQYITDRDSYFEILQTEQGLDRESAKRLMLAIINGKTITEEDAYPDEVVDFYNELLEIRERVMEFEPALVKLGKRNLKKKGRGLDNLGGTVVNLLMCDWENRVLMEMVNFFESHRFCVDVLVFDGCMVRKEDNNPLTEQVLRLCEADVEQAVGVSINLVVKPMTEGLDIPEEAFADTYQAVKTRFEEDNFKCVGQACFYNTAFNMVRVKSKQDLKVSYENLTFLNEDGHRQPFIKEWLSDPEMRQYEFVEVVPPPLKCDQSTTFNLWKGFDVQEVEREECKEPSPNLSLLLNHIRLLSNNQEEIYQFVLKWLAFLFQKPAEKNNVALLFKSKQGLGKDMFYQMLEKMIGQKYSGNTARPERDIFGDFNLFLRNKILVVMNELDAKVGFRYSEKLKDLITNIKEPIRKMRTDVSESDRSFAHYMFFTNKEFPIKVERGDRRLFVSEITQPVPSKEYFDRLGEAIQDPQALRELFDFLMSLDISQVDWIRDKPMTEYMADLLEVGQDREMVFLKDLLTADWKSGETVEIPPRRLLEQFNDFNLREMVEYKSSAVKLGIKIKKLGISGFSTKKQKQGNVYVFDVDECVKWLIAEKYLPADWLSLENNPPSLLKPQGSDGTDNLFVGLPPL